MRPALLGGLGMLALILSTITLLVISGHVERIGPGAVAVKCTGCHR
jgi:hypothetical protein